MVLVVHDVGSYGSFACLRLIPTFLNNGYDLATFDLRGHGRSIEKELDESNNLKYSSWNEEVWSSDLHQVILYILRSAENQEQVVNSLYLYGEGFGASIVLDYVIRYSQRQQLPWQLKGVIACGVMLKEISCKYSNTEYPSKELWKPLSKRPSLFENFLLLQKFLWLLGQIVPNMVCNMRVDPTHWGLVPIDLSLFTR